MLKGLAPTKLNTKTTALLAVPGVVILIILYTLGLGAGQGGVLAPTPGPSQSDAAESAAVAQAEGESKPELGRNADLGLDAAVDVALKLIVVVGIIYATARVLQYLGGRSRGSSGRAAINVLESFSLAQNQILYLVEVAGKVLLIGATGSQLSALAEISDPAVLADLHTQIESRSIQQGSFERHLQAISSRFQAQPQAPTGEALRQDKLRETMALIQSITAEVRQAASWQKTLGTSQSFVNVEDSGGSFS